MSCVNTIAGAGRVNLPLQQSVKADLVICMTDSHDKLSREDLYTELQQYRNTVGPVKHLYMALCSKGIPLVAAKTDPYMLDICG